MITPSKGQKLETIKAVCRIWKEKPKTPILIFPEWHDHNYTVMMYEHVGQHGSGDHQLVRSKTRLATNEEAALLIKEYETHYQCKLKMLKRMNVRF